VRLDHWPSSIISQGNVLLISWVILGNQSRRCRLFEPSKPFLGRNRAFFDQGAWGVLAMHGLGAEAIIGEVRRITFAIGCLVLASS